MVMLMHAAGMIESLSFALYLSYKGLDFYSVSPPSNLLFGGADLAKYSLDKVFTYIPLVESADGWVVELNNIWIDGVPLGFIADRVRFTTGTFLMLIPEPYYVDFAEALVNVTSCGVFPSGFINCPCPTQAQINHTLTFSLSNQTLSIPPAAYFYQVSPTQSDQLCYFFIGPSSASEIVLGTLFQTQFYMEYDYAGQKVGLARSVDSAPVKQESGRGLIWWGWLMAGFLSVCTGGFVFLLCRILKPKRGRKKRRNQSEDGEMLRTVGPSEAASPAVPEHRNYENVG